MFNFNHLYYFYVTAKFGSVTQAAQFLKTSQPSLSMQLKQFEKVLGKKFFTKTGRSIELTPNGRQTYGYCRKIFGAAEELWDEIKKGKDARASRLRIGVTSEIERPFISEMVSEIIKNKESSSQPLISLESASHKEMMHSLESRNIDALISTQPVHGDHVSILTSVTLPVGLVISKKLIPSSLKRNTSIAKLLKELPGGLVLPSYSLSLRYEIDSFLMRHQNTRALVFESDMLVVIGRAIKDGIGFGFFPIPYLSREIRSGVVSLFGPQKGYWQYKIHLITLNSSKADPLINKLKISLMRLEK